MIFSSLVSHKQWHHIHIHMTSHHRCASLDSDSQHYSVVSIEFSLKLICVCFFFNRRNRRQQEIEAAGLENPALMSELRALRQRKDELETHLATLQDSRRQLMVQLEGLMKMLKVRSLHPLEFLHFHIFFTQNFTEFHNKKCFKSRTEVSFSNFPTMSFFLNFFECLNDQN